MLPTHILLKHGRRQIGVFIVSSNIMKAMFRCWYVSLFLLLLKPGASQHLWQFNRDTVVHWYYTGGDEFTADTLDLRKWPYWYGWSRSIFSQKEQEYYTDGANHRLSGGRLNLFARRRDTTARLVDWLPVTDSMILDGTYYGRNLRQFGFTSGMIQSRQKYRYGYFEMRFTMPSEKGYWPAFWLYGGTPNEEIDWMELKTEKTRAIHVGRHSKHKYENKLRKGLTKVWWGDWVYIKGDLTKNEHVIAGEWAPDYVRYYLNGECIAYSRVALPEEKTLCVNLAVPGDDGSFRPGPDKQSVGSGDFSIDYIRVWAADSGKTQAFPTLSATERPGRIASTRLKSKTKFLYGRRSDHAQEGYTLSLIPLGQNRYNLQALGKSIPADAKYSIQQGASKVSGALVYGSNFFELTEHTPALLRVESYGKSLSQIIGE